MSPTPPSDPIVLKILNGVQSGVEVALPDGDYSLGTGPQDDIQLIDVSLLPGHARLRLAGSSIEVTAGEGTIRMSSGVILDSKDAFQAVEPLEILTVGTTRLALGPRSANWASVVRAEGEDGLVAPAKVAKSVPGLRTRLRLLAMPVLALAVLAAVAIWIAFGPTGRALFKGQNAEAEIATVRAALDAFPFGRPVTARQEVDGAIYVGGYVDTPVERRALSGALQQTGVPVRLRLYVLQSMRADIDDLIKSQKVAVSFDLSPAGRLDLSGLILDRAQADAFATLVKDRILGLSSIQSTIKTADTLLGEVQALVKASQLQPWLLLRLDQDLIEVDGALPSDKVDAWVGFLQSYADKFSKQIGLRSFVQLQGEKGRLTPAPTGALTVGAAGRRGDTLLDLSRLQTGAYRLQDLFVGTDEHEERVAAGVRGVARNAVAWDNAVGPRAAARDGAEPPAPSRAQTDPIREASAASRTGGIPAGADSGAQGGAASRGRAEIEGTGSGSAGPDARALLPKMEGSGSGPAGPDARALLPDARAVAAGDLLSRDAVRLLLRTRAGTPAHDPAERDLADALATLGQQGTDQTGQAAAVPDWYLSLLGPRKQDAGSASPCWAGSQLRVDLLLPGLFWLDMLSASRSLSLASFGQDQRLLLLEAALDPKGVLACAKRSPDAARAADNSLYLREVRRNPGFARFITRDLPGFTLDVAGASLASERFVVTRVGDRMFEGSAPDRGSRIASVGELGVVIQSNAGLSAVLFGPEIDWEISN